MLGIESKREIIKGVFADKLREQITSTQTELKSDKAQAQTNKQSIPNIG